MHISSELKLFSLTYSTGFRGERDFWQKRDFPFLRDLQLTLDMLPQVLGLLTSRQFKGSSVTSTQAWGGPGSMQATSRSQRAQRQANQNALVIFTTLLIMG